VSGPSKGGDCVILYDRAIRPGNRVSDNYCTFTERVHPLLAIILHSLPTIDAILFHLFHNPT